MRPHKWELLDSLMNEGRASLKEAVVPGNTGDVSQVLESIGLRHIAISADMNNELGSIAFTKMIVDAATDDQLVTIYGTALEDYGVTEFREQVAQEVATHDGIQD